MLINVAEREAVSRAAGRAALDQAKAMLAHDMEHVRAGYWNRLPEKTRLAICNAAGLAKGKGGQALAQLDAAERACVHAQARRVIREMETILRCCQGGKTTDHGEMAAHAFDGIAADKVVQ